ncbi:MAG: flagellar basal body-associated FliL family protein [Firmicutes bacterium]|nr:flagellar basal body-associated FliL family protein [Bacillota bacterium]
MAEEKAVSKVNEKEIIEAEPTESQKEGKAGRGSGMISKLRIFRIPILIIMVSVLAVGSALVITKVAQGNAATKKEEEQAKKKELGKFITLDPFTVNLVGGQNYLQTAIAFEIDSKNTELENELKERKPQINDKIITILSSKSMDDISDTAGREKLKIEIKKAVDSLLGYGKIERVYFTTFIMQ